MRVWLFYDEKLKYSKVAKDEGYLYAWTNDEDVMQARVSLFKDRGKIVEREFEKNGNSFSNFAAINSDKSLILYNLSFGPEITIIQVPLTYNEYDEITCYAENIMANKNYIGISPYIFDNKYVQALIDLGLEDIYYTTSEFVRSNFSNLTFAKDLCLEYFDDTHISIEGLPCPMEFNIFLLRYGCLLRKDILKSIYKKIDSYNRRKGDTDE